MPSGGQNPDRPGENFSPALPRPLLTIGWGLAAVGLLIVCHSQLWGRKMPVLWDPTAGLGLALVAWFGWPAAGLVFLARLLALGLVAWQLPAVLPVEGPGVGVFVVADALLLALLLTLAWGYYHRQAHGARALNEPRSAILFLMLVPGLFSGVFAGVRAGLVVALAPATAPVGVWLANFWLSQALGVLIVAPPLLAMVTPVLVRRRWAVPEVVDEKLVAHRGHLEANHLMRGDWIEILGLTLGASILALLLIWIYLRGKELAGWQLWGLPLLVIVWASLRQGIRGGTFVAGVSAALPLVFLLGPREPADLQIRLILGNLLAQCSTALLVAASSTWIKASEQRYRQVVSQSPVLIYSARLLEEAPEPAGPAEKPSLPTPGKPDTRTPYTGEEILIPLSLLPGGGGKPPRRREPALQAEVTLVSSASLGLLGCPPEALLGDHRHWLERVYAEDRVVVQAALAQLRRQKQPVTCEYRLIEGLTGLSGNGEPGDSEAGRIANPSHRPPGADAPDAQAARRSPFPARLRWVRDTLAPRFDEEGQLIGWEGVVTEITEQRYLADDLRRTTSMFQTLVSNLPTGVFFVQGPLGRPILVNARARQLLGQREDLSVSLEYLSDAYRLYRKDGTPYPAEDLPVFQALRQGRTTMRDDIIVHRPDGRHIPLVTWGAPVTLSRGNQPDAAVWVLEDLTALHQAEAARRDSEVRQRAIVETMGEGLIVQDKRGDVVEANPAACGLLLLQPETLRGKSLFRLGWAWLAEDGSLLPTDQHPTQLVLRSARPVRNVVLGIRSTRCEADEPGATRWLLLNVMPLGPASALSGVVTTFSDITAYRHAQEVVRSSEEKYRGLIETLPLMVFQTDSAGRVVYSNPTARSTTGYDEETLAQPGFWNDFIHPENREAFDNLLRQALEGQPGRTELRYRAQGGVERVAYVLTQEVTGGGWRVAGEEAAGRKPAGPSDEPEGSRPAASSPAPAAKVTILMVDITRERRLEQDLQRAQRLEMVGRLSSGIAHDFNNLLLVVMGLTDLVRNSLPADHPAHNDLRQITAASEQAAQLASQLLAFSRNRRASTRRLDVSRVAHRTLEMLRPTLPAQVGLEAHLSDEPLAVQADETQLQQVLMNLCLNARDALQTLPRDLARPPARIVVRTDSAQPPGENGSGKRWARLLVEDNGPGMTDQVRAHIFDPFFSTKEHGTGLGLAVVQQIVAGCGGKVEVSSRPGAGACFEVWLPLLAE